MSLIGGEVRTTALLATFGNREHRPSQGKTGDAAPASKARASCRTIASSSASANPTYSASSYMSSKLTNGWHSTLPSPMCSCAQAASSRGVIRPESRRRTRASRADS